jgi:putative cofactor-binding repeat protein
VEFQGQLSTSRYGASVDGVVGKVSPICTAQALQDALVAMSNIGAGTTVSGPVQTGSAGNYVNTYTVNFPIALGGIPPLIARPFATCFLVSVNNNTVSNVGQSINSNGGINVRAGATYCVVSNNRVYNYYQHGITISSPAVVSGNFVGEGQNNNNSYGINANADGTIVVGNRVSKCPWHGIYVSADYCTVSGNVVENAGQFNSACTFIRLASGAKYNVISGNTLIRLNSGSFGLRTEASTTTCGNIAYGNQGTGFGSGNLQNDQVTLTAAGLLPGNIFDGRLQITLSAAGNLNIPAGYLLGDITLNNTTANAVTGGIKLGTTLGGTEVLATVAVGANAKVVVKNSTLSSVPYSPTLVTILYIGAVSAWNSASVIVTAQVYKMDQL